ncbi:MAG: hypothetical protein ACQKBU_04475 [Verrucomicrobiales bacterium]
MQHIRTLLAIAVIALLPTCAPAAEYDIRVPSENDSAGFGARTINITPAAESILDDLTIADIRSTLAVATAEQGNLATSAVQPNDSPVFADLTISGDLTLSSKYSLASAEDLYAGLEYLDLGGLTVYQSGASTFIGVDPSDVEFGYTAVIDLAAGELMIDGTSGWASVNWYSMRLNRNSGTIALDWDSLALHGNWTAPDATGSAGGDALLNRDAMDLRYQPVEDQRLSTDDSVEFALILAGGIASIDPAGGQLYGPTGITDIRLDWMDRTLGGSWTGNGLDLVDLSVSGTLVLPTGSILRDYIAADAVGSVEIGTLSDLTVSGYIDLEEVVVPPNPSPDTARIYAKDNGSGKTQLIARFSDGSEVVIATQP